MLTLKDQAIQHAIDCKWEEAIETNKKILAENPQDIDTLNRLGFAYMQKGEQENAKEYFEKVLEKDETNPIASKNLKRLESFNKNDNGTNGISLKFKTFIEESGKTKTVSLINLADKKTISGMQPGQQVYLKAKRSKIFIQSDNDTYLGMLPQDVGGRLVEYLAEGNEYEAFLKAVDDKDVKVFIRECHRCKKLEQVPSFPTIQPQKRLKKRYN